MTEITTMNVFDLDGVITNPANSQVNIELLYKISSLLRSGAAIAVNTGRSYDWVEKNLINYLKNQKDTTVFERLVVVCEKGGEMITFSSQDPIVTPSRFALRQTDYRAAKMIFDAAQSDLSAMFWDTTKRTMATIEKRPSANLELFHEQQKLLTSLLSSKLDTTSLRIDQTTIATDIESPEAGKYAGAQLIVEWAQAKSLEINKFVCFGDSISDYDMAHCFADHITDVTFVYVGKRPDRLEKIKNINVIITVGKFDQGTLEYLSD